MMRRGDDVRRGGLLMYMNGESTSQRISESTNGQCMDRVNGTNGMLNDLSMPAHVRQTPGAGHSLSPRL